MNQNLIAKARTAKDAGELRQLAKEDGIELTKEQAAACFARLNPPAGELSDEELDNVAGGGCSNNKELECCPQCGKPLKYEKANGIPPYFYYVCENCGYQEL